MSLTEMQVEMKEHLSSAIFQNESISGEVLANFLQWCNKEGFNLSCKVEVKREKTDFGTHMLGMYATDDIDKGEIIFEIPRICQFSAKHWEHYHLMKDYINFAGCNDWLPLIVALMVEILNPRSFLKPYFNIVPHPSQIDAPHFWSREEKKALLSGTGVADICNRDVKMAMCDFENRVKPFINDHKWLFSNVLKACNGSQEQLREYFLRVTVFVQAYSFGNLGLGGEDRDECLKDVKPDDGRNPDAEMSGAQRPCRQRSDEEMLDVSMWQIEKSGKTIAERDMSGGNEMPDACKQKFAFRKTNGAIRYAGMLGEKNSTSTRSDKWKQSPKNDRLGGSRSAADAAARNTGGRRRRKKDAPLMLPMADLLNHHYDHNACAHVKDRRTFMKAIKPIKKVVFQELFGCPLSTSLTYSVGVGLHMDGDRSQVEFLLALLTSQDFNLGDVVSFVKEAKDEAARTFSRQKNRNWVGSLCAVILWRGPHRLTLACQECSISNVEIRKMDSFKKEILSLTARRCIEGSYTTSYEEDERTYKALTIPGALARAGPRATYALYVRLAQRRLLHRLLLLCQDDGCNSIAADVLPNKLEESAVTADPSY